MAQHLRVLRDGFATVHSAGTRRIYSLDLSGIDAVDRWVAGLRSFWEQRLDALGTEVARGKRSRRS